MTRRIVRMVPSLRVCLLCLAVSAQMVGCVNFGLQGRADSPNWGGYSPRLRLQVLQDSFVARVSDGFEGTRHALIPQGRVWIPARLHPAPETVECWRKGTDNGWHFPGIDIVGIVLAGTVVEIHHVRVNRGWSWGGGGHCIAVVYAKVADGEFAGQLVDMSDMSVLRDHGRTRGPNPTLLEPVPGDTSTPGRK